jgi:RNA polymerase sigma factor (sigma-70 family)
MLDGWKRPLDDRGELQRLYQRFGGLIQRRAHALLGDRQLAADVCHDVFVRILRSQPWAPASPTGWLYTTTTNLCLNLLRGTRRQRRALQSMPRADAHHPSTSAALLLRGVPEDLQEIALYYAIDHMSQDEIALVLGVSQKTVSNRIAQLRQIFEQTQPAAMEAT